LDVPRADDEKRSPGFLRPVQRSKAEAVSTSRPVPTRSGRRPRPCPPPERVAKTPPSLGPFLGIGWAAGLTFPASSTGVSTAPVLAGSVERAGIGRRDQKAADGRGQDGLLDRAVGQDRRAKNRRARVLCAFCAASPRGPLRLRFPRVPKRISRRAGARARRHGKAAYPGLLV